MGDLLALLSGSGDPAALIGQALGMAVYPRSLVRDGDSLFFLARRGRARMLGVVAQSEIGGDFALIKQTLSLAGQSLSLGLGAADHANALALRARLPFTAPVPLGLRKSVGLGDRLGIATPGHIRALRRVPGMAPILAQQSIREMERTARTPDDVMDGATWGVFQEGWREGYGADADHLKTQADIDLCLPAGYCTFTLDPGDHVDNQAEIDDLHTLGKKFADLPWGALGSTAVSTELEYIGRAWNLGGGISLTLDREQLLRAACKYGRAVAHLVALYRYLVQALGSRPWELEISVDETLTPTRPEEHFYVAHELKRLGVRWVSLAPRYVGSFEKGVDYIGDLARFERDFALQVAVARALGPCKLSLHSGSDKFSIYPIASRLAGEYVHLKTAGTSYLEALRAIARMDAPLFREILRFAVANWERDKASYRVSARMSEVPNPDTLTDTALAGVLDQFDARQALHVTFGTVLTQRDAQGRLVFRDRLYGALEDHEEAHYAALEAHIVRHLAPFTTQ